MLITLVIGVTRFRPFSRNGMPLQMRGECRTFVGMELFYAYEVNGRSCQLDPEESGHCVRVLRHRVGDEIDVIDGRGTLLHCRLVDDNPKGAEAEVLTRTENWHGHPYHLTVGCCPTKNNDRFEWFVEKATELGVDVIVPLIGDRSERKVYKTERAQRIALSATKQSLKARIPDIQEPMTVRAFLEQTPGQAGGDDGNMTGGDEGDMTGGAGDVMPGPDRASLRLIAYCFEGETPRRSIMDALRQAIGTPGQAGGDDGNMTGGDDGNMTGGDEGDMTGGGDITVLIGPEGDFSPEEAQLALDHGYIPIHLGRSRLRTETAAVTAVEAVYLFLLSLQS